MPGFPGSWDGPKYAARRDCSSVGCVMSELSKEEVWAPGLQEPGLHKDRSTRAGLLVKVNNLGHAIPYHTINSLMQRINAFFLG